MKRAHRQEVEALGRATLAELQQRFPADWTVVGEALVAATETKRPEVLAAFMRRFDGEARAWRARLAGQKSGGAALKAALPHLARAQMARLASEEVLRAAAAQIATGQAGETLRFRWWSGFLVQRLLFERGLTRKPVSRSAFRWLWPLIPQRRILMPLVGPRGIYCFYSRELILALARLVGDRPCLEIAAGDGTLSRFLNAAGTAVHATDDRSWSHAVTYPEEVEDVDAAAALERDSPAVVLCSFPPPHNTFERVVFRTPSVQMYVVLTTRHRFAAGDWEAYQRPGPFALTDDRALAGLLLPPDIDPAVLIFRREGQQR